MLDFILVDINQYLVANPTMQRRTGTHFPDRDFPGTWFGLERAG
jgi:hypothetical protein